jgi:hypothetical protein
MYSKQVKDNYWDKLREKKCIFLDIITQMHLHYFLFVVIFWLNNYLMATNILWWNGAMSGKIAFDRPNSGDIHLNVAIYCTCA